MADTKDGDSTIYGRCSDSDGIIFCALLAMRFLTYLVFTENDSLNSFISLTKKKERNSFNSDWISFLK